MPCCPVVAVLYLLQVVISMQAKERLKKEIESLDPHNILRVYDLVLSLKNQDKKAEAKKAGNGFLRTRLALKNCAGSLSDDIIEERNDRI
jgi:hypothetical protein